jgi:hypothetical protein
MHNINPLKTQLNPICHLLALLGAHHILHVSRMRVKEIGWEGTDFLHVAQGRMNTVINLRDAYNARNFLTR